MGIAEDLADKLAADVIAHLERTGDEDIVTIMSTTLGDSSQTLQEAFITSVRVQRAALRAERLLAKRIAEMTPPAPESEPEPAPTSEPGPAVPEPAAPPPRAAAPAQDAPARRAAPAFGRPSGKGA